MSIPVLTRDQIRTIDRLAVEQYGINSLVLMENAGRGVADCLAELGIVGPVVICCGRGNNAGDGFVIARHLDLRSHEVTVLLWSDPERLQGDAAANYRILRKSEVPTVLFGDGHDPGRLADRLRQADWIVDALLGTGSRGDPRPPLDAAIDTLNDSTARKLAVDVPSGLDCDSGHPSRHTFQADHTCTFVAAKPGLVTEAAEPFVGQLHVLDIGAPRKLVQSFLSAGSDTLSP